MRGGGKGKPGGAEFLQSRSDFPLSVRLGEKTPAWELSRWGGESPLRFAPADEEGFAVRGDRRAVVYRGKKKSHRIAILGDEAFEYDCILEREPESNVVSLRMDGAEAFDFHRQPDIGNDPLLRGSLAVYKKDRMAGEGTGKLCHIMRPEIIDARGRKCHGDLRAEGNRLEIIAPEGFLAGAKYPVVVDPVIGTSTIGRQTDYPCWQTGDVSALWFYLAVSVNRFTLPRPLRGRADSFAWTRSRMSQGLSAPALYADRSGLPGRKISSKEGQYPDISAGGNNHAGWRASQFEVRDAVQSGANVWFGMFNEYFYPVFDYGGLCGEYWWDINFHWDRDPALEDIPDEIGFHVTYEILPSTYFAYSSPLSHQRAIYQGVSVQGLRAGGAGYRRGAAGLAGAGAESRRALGLLKRVSAYAQARGAPAAARRLARAARDAAGAEGAPRPLLSALRGVADATAAAGAPRLSMAAARAVASAAGAAGKAAAGFLLARVVKDVISAAGGLLRKVSMFLRVFSLGGAAENAAGRLAVRGGEARLKSAVAVEIKLDSRIK